MDLCVYMHVHIYKQADTNTHIHTHTDTYTYTHTYIHTHIDTHTHRYKHTFIYTYIHTYSRYIPALLNKVLALPVKLLPTPTFTREDPRPLGETRVALGTLLVPSEPSLSESFPEK